MPSVSVVMTTYNGARHLREQLDSLGAQSHRPDELVVGDDGSTDGTLQILEEFAGSAPFPVHIHKNAERLGFTKNFLTTINRSRGEIVFLCDQDDVWSHEKIETMLAFMAHHPDAWYVTHDAAIVDESLRPTGATNFSLARNHILHPAVHLQGCATALRRELINVIPNASEGLLGHDVVLHLCAEALGRTKTLEKVLLQYRRHSAAATIGSDFSTKRQLARWFRCAILREKAACHAHTEMVDQAIRDLAARVTLLRSLKERVSTPDVEKLESRIDAMSVELTSRGDRRAARSLPFLRRVGSIMHLWRNGAYGAGRGWLSALRDLVLP